VIAALIFTYYPTPSRCTAGGCALITKLTPGCSYLPEVILDPSLPVPTAQPYLVGFQESDGSGPPFCGAVWYAYRYVTPSGGYSPLSPWSGTNPTDPTATPLGISAGASVLPCPSGPPPSGGCSSWGIPSSQSTCSANAPLLGILSPIPSLPQGSFVNVHRQDGSTFSFSSEGDIIGQFQVFQTGAGMAGSPSPVYGLFHDAAPYTNPDPKNQATNCCN